MVAQPPQLVLHCLKVTVREIVGLQVAGTAVRDRQGAMTRPPARVNVDWEAHSDFPPGVAARPLMKAEVAMILLSGMCRTRLRGLFCMNCDPGRRRPMQTSLQHYETTWRRKNGTTVLPSFHRSGSA